LSAVSEAVEPRAGTSAPSVEVPLERFHLRCGAVLLVSPRAGAPVTALHMHMRGGVALDPPKREGCAYLTGALLDQGTTQHSEFEIATMLETAGGSVSGDAHGLSASIAGSSTELLIDLFCEMVTAPTFPRARVLRQRQRLMDRLLVERDEPRAQAEQRFRRLVYGDHWLGRTSYGTLESVARIEASDLRAFHRRWYMPQRAIFALCGDVDPQMVRDRFERALGRWKAGRDEPAPAALYPELGVRCEAFKADRAQVHVFLGHLGIRRSDPDYPALVVMDHVLGTGPGFTNRIARRLRDELGLAYSVSANIHGSAGVHPGTFTAYIGTSPEHVRTAVEGFLAEIRRIQSEAVTSDELELAKNYVTGAFALSFQRASRRASYLISHERHGFAPDHLFRIVRAFEAVSADDVLRVARAHLHPQACCVSAAGPISNQELAAIVGVELPRTEPRSPASARRRAKPRS
jgi:zinc protease